MGGISIFVGVLTWGWPLLLIPGLTLVIAYIHAEARLPSGRRVGVCARCDYDVRGVKVCPECGLAVETGGPSGPRLRGAAWAVLWIQVVASSTAMAVLVVPAASRRMFQWLDDSPGLSAMAMFLALGAGYAVLLGWIVGGRGRNEAGRPPGARELAVAGWVMAVVSMTLVLRFMPWSN